MERKNLKIVVIYGGFSSEREVSLKSGIAIADALRKAGYQQVRLFDLTRNNVGELLRIPMELAFLALHGQGGEDGWIQGMLELAGIPYTGSSVEASALCMNKIRTKQILSFAGLPTPKFVTVCKNDCTDLNVISQMLMEKIGLPMVLKSPSQGSSIGVLIIKDREALLTGIPQIFSLGNMLMAEEFAEGVELTLPIIGNEELTVFPAVEITSENEFYDYQSKYTQGMCHHIIPARISEKDLCAVNEYGKRAYRALSCSGLSRIDFIVDRKKGAMIIEVNTLPGMTEMSLFPDSARFAGVSFEDLVDKIVMLALCKANPIGSKRV